MAKKKEEIELVDLRNFDLSSDMCTLEEVVAPEEAITNDLVERAGYDDPEVKEITEEEIEEATEVLDTIIDEVESFEIVDTDMLGDDL